MTADPATPQVPARRRPRPVFLLVGIVLAVALGIGLFTGVGANNGATSGAPHAGGDVPAFSATNLNGTGTVHVSAGTAGGTPSVLLFFGNWCSACHQELPPLAATVRDQKASGGALGRIKVIGVDSEDTAASAKSFIKSSGVSFPVAYDPNLTITSGDFYFHGDPNAVFVNANGTINRIVNGDQLTPSSFTGDERALIPSGT